MMYDVFRPAWASVFAYALGMGVSFLGQSRYTFGVGKNTIRQFIRFCVMSLCGIAVSYLAMQAFTQGLGTQPFWGTLAVCAIIPVMSFVFMKFWVFAEGAGS